MLFVGSQVRRTPGPGEADGAIWIENRPVLSTAVVQGRRRLQFEGEESDRWSPERDEGWDRGVCRWAGRAGESCDGAGTGQVRDGMGSCTGSEGVAGIAVGLCYTSIKPCGV